MDATAQTQLVTLQEALSSANQLIGSLQQENKLLRQRLEAFIKRYFGGKKNEGIDPAQLELIMAGLATMATVPAAVPAVAPQASPAPHKIQKRKPVRQPLPDHLPVERVVIEPMEVQQQPQAWKKIGEEITEELDWKPAQFIKRLFVRPKYVRREERKAAAQPVSEIIDEVYGKAEPAVVIAPLPARLIERGLPGPGLMAHVVISKYEDHLPLYRQEKIFDRRYRVKISRSTLGEWVEQAAQWLKPIYEAMKQSLLKGDYLQADETPIRYLDPDLPGKSHLGYLWTYARPGGEVVFDWKTSRGRDGPEVFLKSFSGRLQTDGYGVYASLAKIRTDIELLGCMAHCRRKFHEALEEDRRAGWVVRQIGQLYALEKDLREKKAGPALRQARRSAHARPVLNRIEKGLRLLEPKVLPKSRLGEAIRYALGQWRLLCGYVEFGQAEVDNNLVENAIRPTAIGKKNFLFIGHPEAGWRSAVIYSVMGSCHRLGIDPHEYMQDVLRRLPEMKITEIDQVMPREWAKARRQSERVAA